MARPSKRLIRSREARAIGAKRRRLAEAEPESQRIAEPASQQIAEPVIPGLGEEKEEDIGQDEVEDEESGGVAEAEDLQHHIDSLPPSESHRPHSGTPSPTRKRFCQAQSVSLRTPKGRLKTDTPGSGQWLLPEIAQAEATLLAAGWNVQYHWVPDHLGVPGNETADKLAKEAAERRDNTDTESPEVIATTSLAHISRATTQAKRQDRFAWLRKHCAKSYYKARRSRTNPVAVKAPKAIASRFFQLRLNKAPTALQLLWTNRRMDDKCWWCGQGATQTRSHLFKFCKRWKAEQMVLWKARKDATRDGGGMKRWPSTSVVDLLADDRCTEEVLDFLRATKIGCWPDKRNM
ncbi:hypothetical protein FN846DRAFT_996802 [Sphaerosporella brunnea]|uniref:Uncharacterized protein n=1 Tax=Sphaerosporella brunnea TaxID=1250544 RepID=A0A5J5EJ78_9PEZI|nr:hypothetical protein FN846DRAFT_996802 [Sphaerosporella brunnea]